ncbi:hypothetical protein [Vulcanococcus sp. Clear-D1]|uniref:hypothetical protein n=1 Tax=Vulcanococcus sp. Clear-D1 TaxID=2766970 RepID=UPI00199DA516|nr:hypothetical protein [Vulcanococcus sp. Clear-D1]MBD1193951.1 hypothetical protein [Vulcanococcus sp. Clear-D1]MBD1194010.1 hypothetical protein [Vulcanococcus sp. Clear-D1]
MHKCYLAIITRNKWCDYQLITGLPASLGMPGMDLRKRIKSFFPLDYADRDITASCRLVDENIHLQMWCGRISAFNLQGIPYFEQIGRPIKLGVGVLQELDDNYAFQQYSLADIQSLLASEIIGYQSARNHEPRLVELHELNLHGILSYYKGLTADTAAETPPSADAQNYPRSQYLAAEDNESPDDWTDELSIAANQVKSAAEPDGLLYLVRQSLAMRDMLARYSAEYRSRTVQHFMHACTKSKLFHDPEKVIQRDRKRAYEILIDAWSMPPEKRLRLVKLLIPFWQPPAHEIDIHKRDILNRQLDNLAIFMDEGPSPADIEDDFERIADTFYSHIIGMLDN